MDFTPCRLMTGASRLSTRYCLPSSRTIALCSASSLRTASNSWSVMASPVTRRLAWLYAAHNLFGNQRQRQHTVGQARASHTAGHSPDHGSGFVLGDHLSAGRLDGLTSAQSVLAHAGQDHIQRMRTEDSGHGA